MFNKYYLDELAYLREMGREFAARNPDTAGWLAEPGVDPDVERLLEGFSFLTGRIREKLDDELPEFTHSLLQLFWPHYLRPIPSSTVIQFKPKPKAAGKVHQVPRGSEVASAPIDGTPCVFRIVYNTTVVPITLDDLEVGPSSSPYLRMRFKLAKGASLQKLGIDRLRFHFAGGPAASRALRLAMGRYLKRVVARKPSGDGEIVLEGARTVPVGFRDDQGLLPYPNNSFKGLRLLQEYFACPTKYMFLDLLGLERLSELGGNGFELMCELEALPHDMPPVTAAEIKLNCSPAVNLFKHDADPIQVEQKRTEYKIRPGGDPKHFEVYSVDSVKGLRRGDPQPRVYTPFFSFFRAEQEGALLYKTHTTRSLVSEGTDVYLTLIGAAGPAALVERETISIELTATNAQLPSSLGLGDVKRTTSNSPSFATFENVTPPTRSVRPPLEGDLHWSLLSHLTLNYLSLLSAEPMREVLRLYDFRARVDRQAKQALKRKMEGILKIQSRPHTHLFKGTPVRGVAVDIELDEERFGGEGESYLFGELLNEFLGHYVTLNSFSKLEVRGKKYGEVHRWPPRSGARIIL